MGGGMKRGFTLLELLVVVAILMLLAALLFPVFARAKGAAHRSVSQSNVKQITLAQFLYMEDNNDAVAINRDCTLVIDGINNQAPCVPGRAFRGWIDLTVPYVKNYAVFKSPADPTDPVPLPENARDGEGRPIRHGATWGARENGRWLGGEFRSSYARNNNWANNGTYTARYSQAEFPSTLILVYSFAPNSGGGANPNEGVTGSSFTIIRRPDVQPEPGRCVSYRPSSQNNRSNFFSQLPRYAQSREAESPSSERYAGFGLYGFADGHARPLRPEMVRGQCQWGFSPNSVETGNDGVHPDFRF